MIPFFIEASYNGIRRGLDRVPSMSEDLRWGLMITGGIVLIIMAALSVTTVVHDKGTPNQHCTTLLGEATSCENDDVTVSKP